MEEILAAILQFVAEVVLEICLNLEIWPSPLAKSSSGKASIEAALGWLFAGAIMGWIWAKLLPHFFIHHAGFRIANLIVGPLISANISYRVAKSRARYNSSIYPRVNFWYAFWFALGMIALRFAVVPR